MLKTAILIGLRDHGRRMSLKDFEYAEVQEGYVYELSRGVITVSDVPHDRHLAQLHMLRSQLYAYDANHPERIHCIATGAECKILLASFQSERHPDLAIYKTPRPRIKHFWRRWVPEVVVEVVSRSSKKRDYEEKPEEYFAFGIKEYWIFDADRGELRILRRAASRWIVRRVKPPAIYRTRLLPGFELDCAPIFRAAEAAEEDPKL